MPANNTDLTTPGPKSFKYKTGLIWKTTVNITNAANSLKRDVKIAVPLKYLSNFLGSREMPLINCKVHLELIWIENCVWSNAGATANNRR